MLGKSISGQGYNQGKASEAGVSLVWLRIIEARAGEQREREGTLGKFGVPSEGGLRSLGTLQTP